MRLITVTLFTCLAMEMSAQTTDVRKPLTYEEAKAANRPPTPDAGKAMGSWATAVAKQRVFMISAGFTDPQEIRDSVIKIVQAEETQVRNALKTAGWTEKQIETTVTDFTENYLSLASIADQVAQHKK